MVRTRGRGDSSGGTPAKDSSPSLRPSGNGIKKGRKRQLTESSVSPSILTSSAALSPLPGSSSSSGGAGTGPHTTTTTSRYTPHHHQEVAATNTASIGHSPGLPDESHLAPGRRSSHSSHGDQEPIEPSHWEEQEQGYLTPGVGHATTTTSSSSSTGPQQPGPLLPPPPHTNPPHPPQAHTTPPASSHLAHHSSSSLSYSSSSSSLPLHVQQQQPPFPPEAATAAAGPGLDAALSLPSHLIPGGQQQQQRTHVAQDLIETHHHREEEEEIPSAADLVIYGTRESGVQAPEERESLSSGVCSIVLPDDMKQSLECPVCCRIALPPVMQCRNGHVTCNPCRLKVQSCPMCREIDIDIRNLFAEKAVTYMSIPCEYKSFGCRVEIHFKDKEMHERVCKFRPFICPYIECDHKLAADAVVTHVSTAHREECRRSDGPEITASMILIGMYFGGDGAWSPRVITCFGRTFFDVALTRDRWLHHWVWLLGEEEEATHYLYEITAFKGNTKYIYISEVASLRTSDDEIVSEGKCLSISDAIGKRLRDGDKIRYKLKLMRK